jgi:hypothetical protein
MTMQTLTVTSPNTCGLSVIGTDIVYIQAAGLLTFAPDTATFSEYLTPEDAAAAALVIDPSYDVNNIFGPLTLTPVNVTESPITAIVGAEVAIDCEYECSDPAATVSYQWSLNGTEIPGAHESTLELSNVSEAYAGDYTCAVSASNAQGQTGSASASFTLTVNPAPQPSGVLNTGRSGAGPQDLAPSYFPSLSNMPAGVTEADLELYIPGTNTVIPYNNSLPAPFKFDSMGNCYNSGDYRTVIRVAETGAVLATVSPVAGPNKDIFWLYNPVVPAAPTGSSVAIGE